MSALIELKKVKPLGIKAESSSIFSARDDEGALLPDKGLKVEGDLAREIASRMGITTEIIQDEYRLSAAQNYPQYIQNKQVALDEIRARAAQHFANLAHEYMLSGYSKDQALKEAEGPSKAYYAALKKVWQLRYPSGDASKRPM